METNEEIGQFLFYLKYYVKSTSVVDLLFSLCERKLNVKRPTYVKKVYFNFDDVLIKNDWSVIDLKEKIISLSDASGLIILYDRILTKTLDDVNKTIVVVCIYLAYEMMKIFNDFTVELILNMGRILQNRSNGFVFNL
ncbi:hypothetical protein LCDVSa010L [Lymphocystis disease virus 3]|uniref:Uncharacterized protein n=1 Tax=Lymphocystis disease virus 3 TaxID=2560566 RepID=A0A1B2RVR6_9VIRU|nr:hypothetical protein BZK12_gp010 [Lymphocystis disease virus Sa]AOC55094.1 hypothetical protein LCDVSa010L [Lymphocystis disease virus 3]